MAEKSFWKRRWKLLVNIVTVSALVILIIAIHKQLVETFTNLGKVHAWALLLLIPVELVNYHAQTKLYQGLLRALGERLSYKYLYRLSLELNFVNHVFPSGGVTGISYFGVLLRRKGIRGTRSTIVQAMKLVLVFLSMEIILLAGFFMMAAKGHVNGLILLLSGALAASMIFGTVGFGYLVGSRERINAFFTFLTRVLNRLIRIVRPHSPEAINVAGVRRTFDEVHENYVIFKSRPRDLQAPFWWAFLANITEILAVYVVYIAFGHWVNVGAVILAYIVANLAGFVSVLPGGVGVYESLMTVVLATAGVAPSLSLPVTIMYRVLNTLLQLPPGYVLYQKSLQEDSDLAEIAAARKAEAKRD